MNHKHLTKSMSIFMLLVLALGAAGGIPARASQTEPESAPPAGLSDADWSQIQGLLRGGSVPSQQAYLKASNTGVSDYFGYSVAVSGDTVVVGADGEDSNATGVNGDQTNNSASSSGAAYIFTRSGTIWSQQAYLKASNTELDDRFGISVAISGDTVVVGAWGEDSNATGVNGDQTNNSASSSGAAYVFTRSGTTWSQQAYLKASNTEADDIFGLSVAISGETVVVGAEWEDSNATGVDGNQSDDSASESGAAYIFLRSGTTWSQQAYLKASNTDANDYFGLSVAISGDTVVVGARGEDSNATGVNGNQSDNSASDSGAAYVFTRSGTNWSQQAYLKASNTEASDLFGSSVAISGDTVVVGAWGEDSNATGVNGDQTDNSAGISGAAYVFVRSGTTWSQQAYLKASNTESYDYFGSRIAISGEKVVVGAYYEGSNATGVNGDQNNNLAFYSGAAYVFTRSGTTWSQQAYLKASNTEAEDIFGYSVAISGDTVVVGAWGEDSNATGVNGDQTNNSAFMSGAAYIFTRSGTTCSQQAYPKASNTEANDAFGFSVAISGDTVVVGAYGEDSNATGVNGNQDDNSAINSGAAYIFVRSGTSWSQQAYLKASNTGGGDYFGASVAISGDTVVVAAKFEDSSATGVGGDQNDNSAANSGAVYVFTRSGTTWSQQAYMKASNAEAGDYFGYVVTIDEDTILVGAPFEDSNSTGVGGSQADNTAADSGAAFVFTRSGTTWVQQAYLKASNTEAQDYFGASVAISGDTGVVGALGEDSNAIGVDGDINNNAAADSGAAYVFARGGTTWSQQAYLKASNTGASDLFGSSVAISGDTVVVAAYQEDSNATGVNGDQTDGSASSSGAAYVFTRSGTNWSQQAYLKASNTGAYDQFGRSVAISGDTVVVAAYQEDSNATGVNGNQTDNSASDSGAAYVFTRNGTTWTQKAYVKASNTETIDWFGHSVDISGDTLVVGAYGEDSNATGVNGNQSDNSASGSGATYVFTIPNDVPTDIALSNNSVAENQPIGTTVGTLSTTDTDTGDMHTYSLACTIPGSDDASFAIAGNVLNTAGVFDYEIKNSYAICVRTTDDHAATYDKNFTINVMDVNDPPNDISLSNSSVAENQPAGAVVGTFSTDDQEPGDTHTYALACSTAGADDASFQVSGASLQTNAVFNYEAKSTYAICVRTEDNHGATFDKNFAINITDVNDAPGNITLTNSTVVENQPIGTLVGTLAAVDQDAGDTHTYSLACSTPSADDIYFQVSGNSLQTNAVFDYETRNSYFICVRTEDGYSATFDKYFTITVTKEVLTLTSTFRSTGAQDGWILESGENTNVGGTMETTATTFNLGDGAADKQYRAVLSFNTASLADTAVITKVTLKIKRPATGFLVGNNSPFTWGTGLKVDGCRNFFGTTAALQLGDFNFTNATNCKLLAGAFGGTPAASWYSANILGTAFTRINRIGITQFRLRFAKDDNDDGAADYMKFYSGNYSGAASRPTMVIEYYIP